MLCDLCNSPAVCRSASARGHPGRTRAAATGPRQSPGSGYLAERATQPLARSAQGVAMLVINVCNRSVTHPSSAFPNPVCIASGRRRFDVILLPIVDFDIYGARAAQRTVLIHASGAGDGEHSNQEGPDGRALLHNLQSSANAQLRDCRHLGLTVLACLALRGTARRGDSPLPAAPQRWTLATIQAEV